VADGAREVNEGADADDDGDEDEDEDENEEEDGDEDEEGAKRVTANDVHGAGRRANNSSAEWLRLRGDDELETASASA
jgi:hypothetical protein